MELIQKKEKIIFYSLLILCVGLRLIGITNELNDYHHFRQTYTAAFSKYFFENSMNLFDPRLDILNYKNISEFQLYSYLVAILYKIFGYHDIIGRLVSIFFSALSFVFLYKLIKRIFDVPSAVFGIFLYTVLPLSIYYSRVFMLESMMIFLSIASIYSFLNWLDSEKNLDLFWAILACALTLLIKIPTVYILFPIIFLIFQKHGLQTFRRVSSYVYGFCILLPAFYWYFLHARFFPELNEFVDKRVAGAYYSSAAWEYYIALMKNSNTWTSIFLQSIAEYHLAIAGFYFTLGGAYLLVKQMFMSATENASKQAYLFLFWILGFICFILGFIAPNLAHEYYQLPIVIPCVAISGYYLKTIFSTPRISLLNNLSFFMHILLLVAILPFSYNKLQSRLKPDTFYTDFAIEVKKIVPKEEKVIAIDNTPRTEVFYFSDRKGYQLIVLGVFVISLNQTPEENRQAVITEILEYQKKGAKYFIVPYREFGLMISWLKDYLDKNHICKLGCDITPEDVLAKNPKIKGFIYELKP
ncbi:MAG: glycosyltransferase family 39 protein [Leptospiraceae bacterium]|nr:glycosyltransferase family 39 protein [Leptospiraceae bacterium]